jgi:hypothetical protein
VLQQDLERYDLEGSFVGGRQHHGGGAAVVVGAQPVQRGNAPAIAGQETGEPILGNRRQQVVTDGTLVLQERSCHYSADGVPADVLGPARTAAVAVVAGEWVGAARFQRTAQHVAIRHVFSIAPLGVKFAGTCGNEPSRRCGVSPTRPLAGSCIADWLRAAPQSQRPFRINPSDLCKRRARAREFFLRRLVQSQWAEAMP